MKRISLNGEYILRFADEQKNPSGLEGMQSIPSKVPGNVEIDLMNAGILPDIYFGNNVKLLRQYEFYRWRYEKTFIAPMLEEGQRAFLHFGGVDCIALYELNGNKFAESDNALIDHRFDVTDLLLDGENHLAVDIKSPILHAAKLKYDAYSKALIGCYEALFVRKAPSAYGWDIMPRTVSAGIWRDVVLEIEEPNEIEDLSLSAAYIRGNTAYIACSYRLHTNVHNYEGLSLRITGRIKNEVEFIHETPVRFVSGRADFYIENPKLWWPLGYGEPNVYDITAEVLCKGKPIAEYKTSMGVKTVKLDRTEITDARGGEFRFIINGEPVFCKGSNWVPADAMHSRDASRYKRMLEMWTDTGSNILRCWGGNVYEDHAFYDYCDRHGIMVWQDFTMACGMYPIDEEFMAVMRHEAESVVTKLRNHPSIILWSGDNECDESILAANLDPSINRITREVLPQVVNRLDPYRPYLPSSPYISPEVYRLGKGDRSRMVPLMPEQHLWGPRDYYKSTFYTQATSHFTSETGYHGCNNLSSIKKFISQEKLWPWQDNDEWLTHASEMYGQDGPYAYRIKLMADQIHEMFGFDPDNLEDFILASQISQAGSFTAFANATTEVDRVRISHGDQKLMLIEWTVDGIRSVNHYVLGMPPFSFDRYKGWLKKIADLDGSFDASQVEK